MPRLSRSDLLSAVVLAAVFAVSAYGCIAFTAVHERVASLWIPNALAIGSLLRNPLRPAAVTILTCAIANVLVNLLVDDSLPLASALALANAVEIVVVVWLLRSLCGMSPDLGSGRTVMFVVSAAVVGALASSLVAGFAFAPLGTLPSLAKMQAWLFADSLSILVLLPVVLIGIDAWRDRRWPPRDGAQRWLAIVAIVLVGTVLVFGQSRFPFLFLVSPLIVYATFSGGMLGTAVAVLIVTIVAIFATAMNSGPITLVIGGDHARILAIQTFLAANVLMGLPIAALLSAKRRAHDDAVRARDYAQEILDNVSEVIFRTDEVGRWTMLNPAWEELTGFTLRESIGSPIHTSLHPDDR
ncbi:MAG: PAS domain-containing protein, partial [Sphingomonadales bacterium]